MSGGVRTAGTIMTDSHARSNRLRLALAINLVIVAVQVVLGFVADSLGLLSDAAHNLTDVAGLGLAVYAVQLTRRPATSRRSFGWHRGTILAAQANAAMILALTVWILIEGVRRLLDPRSVDGGIVVVVASVAFVANTLAVLAVREPHEHAYASGHAPAHDHDHDGATNPDLNMQAAMLHLVSDAAASLGVVVVGLVILLTDGWYWLDPAVSIAIGLSIGWHAWRLLRSSNAVLLEGTPDGLDPVALQATMLTVDGVDSVHDLHVWSIASNLTALSAHLVVRDHHTLAEAQQVAASVRDVLAQRYGIAHSTLELEDSACDENGLHCDFGVPRDRHAEHG